MGSHWVSDTSLLTHAQPHVCIAHSHIAYANYFLKDDRYLYFMKLRLLHGSTNVFVSSLIDFSF